MKEISHLEFEDEVLKKELAVVDFYSTECPPCEALAPKFEALAELYGDYFNFVKIFRQGNRELAEKYGVKSSPTILFFKNGQQVGEILSGGIKKSDIIRNLNLFLSQEQINEINTKIKLTESKHRVVILGGGPAGLTAGIYLSQAKIDTVIIDTALPGGQVATTHLVSNYPGFSEPINGYMLAHHMYEHAKKTGVKFKVAVDITDVNLIQKKIIIDETETIYADIILIATGAYPKPLNIPGEKEYKGKGVSYCATCDAKYYQDKEVIVIGGGNSAVEESEFISKFASKITIIHQFAELTANKEAQEKAFANPKINIIFESEPREFIRKNDKMEVIAENLRTKEFFHLTTDGIFVFVGMQPNSNFIREDIKKDQWGYIITDDEMKTSIKGVYAAGDVVSKKYRQITTAVADGTIAAIAITKELN